MDWIYLAPHLDDVALSCGGLVWEQAQAGDKVAIWTICAGDPPPGHLSPFAESLHNRWETGGMSMPRRRAEDELSCQRLGASLRHFSIPDCIYRRHPEDGAPLYASEEAIFGPLHTAEADLVASVWEDLVQHLAAGVQLVCPLALGGHVDHRLVRAAAGESGLAHWFYGDYPYVLKERQAAGLEGVTYPVSLAGVMAWIDSVAAHQSQLSTFWPDLETMREAILDYCRQMGGVRLWKA